MGFLSSYDGELMDPLVSPGKSSLNSNCEGSPALLLSHARGIGHQDNLKGNLKVFLKLWQESMGSLNL